MRNIIREIETKYPVAEISINGTQVWSYLRMVYYFRYHARMSSENRERRTYSKSRLSDGFRMLRACLYGFTDWFGKYDFIAIAPANDRRQLNGRYFNRLVDPIIDEIGPGRVLLIEDPAPDHYSVRQVHTKRIVSSAILMLTSLLLRKVVLRHPRIEKLSLLQEIQHEYGLKIDDMMAIRAMEAGRRIFTLIFRVFKPRCVFVSDYYSHMAAIRAANDLGIMTVEIQHGYIGDEHPAYTAYTELNRSFFPGYLLAFGKNDLDAFDNSRFIDPDHVYPVGNYYIDYVKNNFKPEPDLLQRFAGYRRIVAITLLLGMEKRLMEFICRAASLDNTIYYVVIPRVIDSYLSDLRLPDNVSIIKGRNFYELMMYMDFHSTIYSTCAVEAPAMGVQNILINIDNEAKRYYEEMLAERRITRFVETPEEYVDTINSFERLDRNTVCKLSEYLIAPDYEANIRKFIKAEFAL